VTGPALSIGILAHNEAARISEALTTLFAQDVFEQIDVEVIVVANGCTDNTVPIARQCIRAHQSVWSRRGHARVEEIAVAGKPNAWNEFVHQFSSPSSSVLVLMDADIKLLHVNLISSMFEALRKNPEAVVCVDRPIKDIAGYKKRTFFQRLLLAATPEIKADHVPLCGQLYCALSSEIRLIKLPFEILAEDGFIRALLLTKGFSSPENPRRIILEPNVAHSFKSVGTLTELFRHEKWLVAASIVNMLLFKRFSAEANASRNAMDLMKYWEAQNPNWIREYVRAQVSERGWRILPRHWWLRRFIRLQNLSPPQKLRRLPVAVLASAADVIIFIGAIRDVHRGNIYRYWGK
jgi:glycosyltransferase involved in cell wall biosynthesis